MRYRRSETERKRDEFQQNRSNNSNRNADFKRRIQESRKSTEVCETNCISDEFDIIRSNSSSTNFDKGDYR